MGAFAPSFLAPSTDAFWSADVSLVVTCTVLAAASAASVAVAVAVVVASAARVAVAVASVVGVDDIESSKAICRRAASASSLLVLWYVWVSELIFPCAVVGGERGRRVGHLKNV